MDKISKFTNSWNPKIGRTALIALAIGAAWVTAAVPVYQAITDVGHAHADAKLQTLIQLVISYWISMWFTQTADMITIYGTAAGFAVLAMVLIWWARREDKKNNA